MSKPFKYIQDLNKSVKHLLTPMLLLCIFRILGYIVIVSKLTTEAISIMWYIELLVYIAFDRDTQSCISVTTLPSEGP